MSDFDCVVLGGGTGNIVAAAAADAGREVALVERGRLGGTCLNRGCNPSKKLIHRANLVETVRGTDAFGIDATLHGVDYEAIVDEVAEKITAAAESKAERAREAENVTFFQTEGRFVDERTVEVGDEDGGDTITGETVVLAGGSRPVVPDAIDGTDEVDFLTSDDALWLDAVPDRLVVVGGGYIAVELSHLFGQMGADVVIVGRGERLVDREDRDVAERLTAVYKASHELHLGYEATTFRADGDDHVVVAESEAGDEIEVAGDELLLATGRRPNTDLWNVEAAGLETTDAGFVATDDRLETSVDDVWAIGDIAGNYLFKHSGDKEAEYVVENAIRGGDATVEYPGMAHAIFGSPELASLGATESGLDDDDAYSVGTIEYDQTALGAALDPDAGFAKAVVGEDGAILGFHVVGPHASILVHEVSTAVAAGGDAERLAETIHVHPALSEVVQGAFRDATGVGLSGI